MTAKPGASAFWSVRSLGSGRGRRAECRHLAAGAVRCARPVLRRSWGAINSCDQRRFTLPRNRPNTPAVPRSHWSCRAASTACRRSYVDQRIFGGLGGNGPSSASPLAPTRRQMLSAFCDAKRLGCLRQQASEPLERLCALTILNSEAAWLGVSFQSGPRCSPRVRAFFWGDKRGAKLIAA